MSYCILLNESIDPQGRKVYRVANCCEELDKSIICGPVMDQYEVFECEPVNDCSDGRRIVYCRFGE